MVDVCYDVCQNKITYTNDKDTCQGADSPRWTWHECSPVSCKTKVVTYVEGWCPDKWSGGPSLTNEFEVIEDDLVKKY